MLTLAIFGVLVGLVLLGVPIFAAMGLTAAGAFILMGDGFVLPLMAQRMYVATTGFTLLAIPFFILAGNLMNYGGITERVFAFARALVGHLRGGLGHVNVVASMLFSGMSGAAVADAAGLGLVEMKAMTKNGYDREFSAAITAASSTIGPVVPPSIAFVVYGSMTGVSIIKLFLAGFVPGILMGLAMMIAVFFIARRRGYPVDPWPSLRHLWQTFRDSFLALMMPVIIIGGILGGIFTPTEAAVVASLYAFLVGGVIYREFGFRDVPGIIWESVRQSVKVLFIIAVAGFFSWLMIRQSVPEQVINSLTSLTSTPWIIMAILVFILLVLGCFMEGIAVMVITIPVFMPLIERFDIDPLQFGVIMVLCSMIGLLTPPIGMSLYAVSTVSGVSIGKLSRELWPYLLGILIVTLLIAYIPELGLWLPNALMPE
jgi:C4-dicarboxylate transporter, DctM subunit